MQPINEQPGRPPPPPYHHSAEKIFSNVETGRESKIKEGVGMFTAACPDSAQQVWDMLPIIESEFPPGRLSKNARARKK